MDIKTRFKSFITINLLNLVTNTQKGFSKSRSIFFEKPVRLIYYIYKKTFCG